MFAEPHQTKLNGIGFLSTEGIASLLAAIGPRLAKAGIYFSLIVIYAWFGGMKFTAYEAEGLVPLVSNSPFLFWLHDLLGVYGFSTFLGFLELTIGFLIAGRLLNPAFSMFGGLLSSGLFVTTLSFMVSTPGVFEANLGFPAITVAPGQFLLKDIGLLAASLWVAVDSAIACLGRR